jgi:hypothetical protein
MPRVGDACGEALIEALGDGADDGNGDAATNAESATTTLAKRTNRLLMGRGLGARGNRACHSVCQ